MRCTHDVHSQSAHVRRRSGKSPSCGFCQVDMYAKCPHPSWLVVAGYFARVPFGRDLCCYVCPFYLLQWMFKYSRRSGEYPAYKLTQFWTFETTRKIIISLFLILKRCTLFVSPAPDAASISCFELLLIVILCEDTVWRRSRLGLPLMT